MSIAPPSENDEYLLAGQASELERLQLPVGNRAKSEGDRDLERGGRREAGAGGKIRRHGSDQSHGRPAEGCKLGRDRLRVASPTRCCLPAAVGPERWRDAG